MKFIFLFLFFTSSLFAQQIEIKHKIKHCKVLRQWEQKDSNSKYLVEYNTLFSSQEDLKHPTYILKVKKWGSGAKAGKIVSVILTAEDGIYVPFTCYSISSLIEKDGDTLCAYYENEMVSIALKFIEKGKYYIPKCYIFQTTITDYIFN